VYDQFNKQGGAGGQLVEVSLLESGAKTSSSPPNYAMKKSADRSVNLPRQASDRSTLLTNNCPCCSINRGRAKLRLAARDEGQHVF
jgi:hypothetical protein